MPIAILLATMQPNWNEERARHWHLFTPPARPSPGDVAIYEQEIRAATRVGASPWLILGCTPELRVLARAHAREAVCVDWNEAVYRVLGEAVGQGARESLLCADWLGATIERPVDLVLADGSLNMLPRERHDEMLAKIAGFLAPGGVALVRVHVATPPRLATAARVFEDFRARRTGEGLFTATRTDLDMLWLDPES